VFVAFYDSAMALKVINMTEWIKENKKSFVSPVRNKLMHNSQLNIMFVGGPNTRKDYHIEEGEEFFYMIKGDMCLKVVEKGIRKDVVIKEGQTFLLPARVPHSPQRFENTVGLVIERQRLPDEMDILRYYVEPSLDVLYEKAFHCVDLGTQLAPIIKAYFNSEAYNTGNPDPQNILREMPFQIDSAKDLDQAVELKVAADGTGDAGSCLFGSNNQFVINIKKFGSDDQNTNNVEHWIWQFEGGSVVKIAEKELLLQKNDTLLIPTNTSYSWVRSVNSAALQVSQDGKRK